MSVEGKQRRRNRAKERCFTGEDALAYFVAGGIQRGDELAILTLRAYAEPRFLRLVADALEGTLHQPTPTRLNIVTAYNAAADRTGILFHRDRGLIKGPTLAQVKDEFVRLFGLTKLPKDWPIRKTLKVLHLPLIKVKGGRPKTRTRK